MAEPERNPDPHGDLERLIERLPAPYAVALRLARRDCPHAVIAIATGVDESAVSALLELAQRKLGSLQARRSTCPG